MTSMHYIMYVNISVHMNMIISVPADKIVNKCNVITMYWFKLQMSQGDLRYI